MFTLIFLLGNSVLNAQQGKLFYRKVTKVCIMKLYSNILLTYIKYTEYMYVKSKALMVTYRSR